MFVNRDAQPVSNPWFVKDIRYSLQAKMGWRNACQCGNIVQEQKNKKVQLRKHCSTVLIQSCKHTACILTQCLVKLWLSGWHADAPHDDAFAYSGRDVHSLRTPPWPPLWLQELLRYKSLQSWHTTTNDHLKCKTPLSFCLHLSVTAIIWDVLHAAQDLPGDDSTNGLPTYLFANRKQR